MKHIIIAILLFTSIIKAEPIYMQNDKQKHFAVSATIATLTAGMAKNYGLTTNQAILVGFTTSLLAGIAKEVNDDKFDNNDLLADTIGSGLGAIASAQFTWKF